MKLFLVVDDVVAIMFLPFEISHQSSPGWRGHC